MPVQPLKAALLELAREHEERARRLEQTPQSCPHCTEAERHAAERARLLAESLRF